MEQGVLGTRGHAEEGALSGRVTIMGEASVVLSENEQSDCDAPAADGLLHPSTAKAKCSGWTMESTDTS